MCRSSENKNKTIDPSFFWTMCRSSIQTLALIHSEVQTKIKKSGTMLIACLALAEVQHDKRDSLLTCIYELAFTAE